MIKCAFQFYEIGETAKIHLSEIGSIRFELNAIGGDKITDCMIRRRPMRQHPEHGTLSNVNSSSHKP